MTILEDFTEELLGMHDAEIQRLKLHYEDHKELFDGVNQWEESWRLFLELEVSSLEQETEGRVKVATKLSCSKKCKHKKVICKVFFLCL